MSKRYIAFVAFISTFSYTKVALALEDFGQLGVPTFKFYVLKFVNFANILIPLLISLALVGFLVGVTRYGFSQDSDESKTSAKLIMFWGVIILFVMASIWGILKILTNTFFGA